LLDIFVFPPLERAIMMEGTAFDDRYQLLRVKEVAPTVYTYVHQMRTIPEFKGFIVCPVAFNRVLTSLVKGERFSLKLD